MAEKSWRPRLLVLLFAIAFAALSGRGYADDSDFSLEDALVDNLPTKRPTHKPPKKPSSGTGDFDLADFFSTPLEMTTKPAKATTKPYPKKPDDVHWNILATTTTTQPKTTKPSPRKPPAKDPLDFDLSDALDDRNDGQGGGMPNVNPGGGSKGRGGRGGKHGISDDDLARIVDEGDYHPDKKKGASGGSGGGDSNYNDGKPHCDRPQVSYFAIQLSRTRGALGGFFPGLTFLTQHYNDYLWKGMTQTFFVQGALVETGTIAGIVSGLAMALIGAVSSYISYQQKKFCFSIQQGLNAEYVKGENMEAVVTEEPQVKYSVLEPQSAEPPPPQENAKV